MRHTPGPWKLSALGTVLDSNSKSVVFDRWDSIAQIANAHLAAAAPDLLEASRTAISFLRACGFRENTKAITQLRTAIAKAEGE